MTRREPRRGDGYKKIDKIIVSSTQEGKLEFPLRFNPHKTKGAFLVEVGDEDVFADSVVELRSKVELLVDERQKLTWERWIRVDYTAHITAPNGDSGSRYLNEEEADENDDEPAGESPDDRVTQMEFDFYVFDLSSPITLSSEARRAHQAASWGGAPTQERLRRHLTRDGDSWESEPTHSRVSVDILNEKNVVFLPYSEERYQALVAIHKALGALDKRLRAVLGSPDLDKLLAASPFLALPAPQSDTQPRRKRKGA